MYFKVQIDVIFKLNPNIVNIVTKFVAHMA